MRFTINMELWTIITAVAALVAAVGVVVIARRLARIGAILQEIRALIAPFRNNLGALGTVLQAHEETIRAAREEEESKAETLLLDPHDRPR